MHPFDVLKVRLQINEGANVGVVGTFKTLVRNEGARGLYSGLSAAAAHN